MHQKYVIHRNIEKNNLRIKEYAIIDKTTKKVEHFNPRNNNFSFLCEENYESEIIVSAISKGLKALIAVLRTQNIFPVEPYAIKIAETVKELYKISEDGSVELFFNDFDLVSV